MFGGFVLLLFERSRLCQNHGRLSVPGNDQWTSAQPYSLDEFLGLWVQGAEREHPLCRVGDGTPPFRVTLDVK